MNLARSCEYNLSGGNKVIIRGRQLFQIFLTGGRALNILFYSTLNQKTNHIKYKPNTGFLSVSKMARGGGAIIWGRRLIEGWLLFDRFGFAE